MPSLKIIGPMVLEKVFKGFYHIWACQPSCLCDLYHLHKLSFPLPKEDLHDFGIDWPIGFREEDV